MDSIKVGDLIVLKGFTLKPNLAPVGLVVERTTRSHYRILWANQELAERWACTVIVHRDKVEKLL